MTCSLATVLALGIIHSVFVVAQSQPAVSPSQKQDFIRMVHDLPHQGEFFTEEAVTRAAPYLPVLLALTDKDLNGQDFYPFAAISRGLCDRKPQREYVLKHFSDIHHPELKLLWATLLFNKKSASPEIVQFLQDALQSKSQAAILSEMVGPGFEDFKKRVLSQQSR